MQSRSQVSPKGLGIEVVELGGDWSGLDDVDGVIATAAGAVAGAVPSVPDGLITVALSSDAHVAELNEQFRGKAKPTNVLSFPSADKDSGVLGDIVMASETVVREAKEQGISFKDHVQHLTVHGILHLLGYDHEAEDDAEQMEAIEIKILSSIGVANPYTDAPETGKRR